MGAREPQRNSKSKRKLERIYTWKKTNKQTNKEYDETPTLKKKDKEFEKNRFTGFYLVLPNFTSFSLGITWFTEFYWVLLGSHWVLSGFHLVFT